MGCRAGGRSFISVELPGLIGAGERNMADDGTAVLIGQAVIVCLLNELSYFGRREGVKCETLGSF